MVRKTTSSSTSRRVNLGDQSIRSRLNRGGKQERVDIADVWSAHKKAGANKSGGHATSNGSLASRFKSYISLSLIKLNKAQERLKISPVKVKSMSPRVLACLVVVIILLGGISISQKHKTPTKGVAGLSTGSVTSSGAETPDDGSTDEIPTFSILYPSNKKDLSAVTRKSPTGVLLHTYGDTVDGAEIEITQQELPESFKSSPVIELEKVAKSFQATNVIQIDETIVYHGLDEKTGVQSLFTIKDSSLISIRSAQKLEDDVWAGYILALQEVAQ